MLHTTNPIIKHITGLLHLAKGLSNVSKACKTLGVSREMFYRYRELTDKNRTDDATDITGSGQWAGKHGVILEFIKQGKPTQNGLTECTGLKYWIVYLFRTLNEAREITERWLNENNTEQPHKSLNNLTPEEYRLEAEKPKSQKVRGTKARILTNYSFIFGCCIEHLFFLVG